MGLTNLVLKLKYHLLSDRAEAVNDDHNLFYCDSQHNHIFRYKVNQLENIHSTSIGILTFNIDKR